MTGRWRATFAHYRATVALRDASLSRGRSRPRALVSTRCRSVTQTRRLAAYRGVTRLGGLCMAAEVFDWRRFPAARSFMCFTGLVPSEHSTGLTRTSRQHHPRRQPSHPCPARRGRLGLPTPSRMSVPASPPPRRPPARGPSPGPGTRKLRLSGRFRELAARKNVSSVVAAAVGTRTRRVPVGRDERNRLQHDRHARARASRDRRRDDRVLHDAPGHRRCRTDPRGQSAHRQPSAARTLRFWGTHLRIEATCDHRLANTIVAVPRSIDVPARRRPRQRPPPEPLRGNA